MDPPAPATTDPGAATPAAQRSASGPRTRRALLGRLRRIEGQVRGIARMVDGDADCIEILTQVAAVTHALEAAALMLVDQHLRDCLQRGAATTLADEQTEQVEQALRAVERLLRT
ncbi:metal-sensitive transcriptional regulator [Propionicicella superfundia]|uniref:metal-sensitive transcriptional regulator n=1 Tax=Propionicicella superfundia TaxID=348582 RepID=UPI000A047737|nr:metal-sensitive transcriptional regulator [Propionicicella superfundia]MCB0891525.1 metal-sensitive transcriptional regulator [Propionibacteriaceae bacterium]NMD47050.1 metal-sensitive transcriptional regulator [Propionibacterium sp.]HMQ36653.1 metal-sensitive transcriptional regulator [Micropruina sp.]HMR21097.1 metal-sensitive transcriptional regulator [Micropruina sp.]